MGALFTAVDGVAFYHRDGALALTMLERAYVAGGSAVERRVSPAWPVYAWPISRWWTRFRAEGRFASIRPEDVSRHRAVGGRR